MPTIERCKLIADPAAYDQQIVRVSTTYMVGYEAQIFRDETCTGDVWVTFDRRWKQNTDPKVYRSVMRVFRGHSSRTSAHLVVVGRFHGIRPTQKILGRTSSTGFGHLNSYDFQFDVLAVEGVKSSL